MGTGSSKSKNNNYWVITLTIVFLLVIAAFVISRQKDEPEKGIKNFSHHNHQGWNDNSRRQSNSTNNENNGKDKNRDQIDPHWDFIEKGYSEKDIQKLTSWGLEASEVPNLKSEKRKGVVNTLAVDNKTEMGSYSQLVIIKKESPHVSRKEPEWTKIEQSSHFADASSTNETIIRFAIAKIIEKGYNWKYNVYVLQANSNSIISGPSAGSGVYMAFLSACYSDCAIPKNLAITGALDTEKREVSNQIESVPKKYQWRTDRCVQCQNRSAVWHLIFNKADNKIEQSTRNATNPDTELVFCNQGCFQNWWDKNVYNCSECSQQRFGNCSCCGKFHAWIREGKKRKFCSPSCLNKYYPPISEEGKIVAIGGIRGKITAAVERGCDTIIISKENSSDYYSQVPSSIQAKVKRLYEVENYKDLQNLFPF